MRSTFGPVREGGLAAGVFPRVSQVRIHFHVIVPPATSRFKLPPIGPSELFWSLVPKRARLSLLRLGRWRSSANARKHKAELDFWEAWVRNNGVAAETDYYRKFMMDMGNVDDESFFDNLVCLDVGCGPRGSLTWLRNARAAIGLDPLADQYLRFGIDQHDMTYLCAGAERIPFPSRYIDVVFSMNSLDHVDDPVAACHEIRRVLKPGGYFIGSLNLRGMPTDTEPWPLTEKFLEEYLFAGWERQFYKVRPKLRDPSHFGPYKYFYEECPPALMESLGPGALWCRFRVPK